MVGVDLSWRFPQGFSSIPISRLGLFGGVITLVRAVMYLEICEQYRRFSSVINRTSLAKWWSYHLHIMDMFILAWSVTLCLNADAGYCLKCNSRCCAFPKSIYGMSVSLNCLYIGLLDSVVQLSSMSPRIIDHRSSSTASRILQVPAYSCSPFSESCQPGSAGSPFMVGPTPPASDATDTELTMVMRVFLGLGAIAAQVTCKYKPVMFALRLRRTCHPLGELEQSALSCLNAIQTLFGVMP